MRSTNERYKTVCRLGYYRDLFKMNQQQLADAMELSKRTIIRFESGETIPTVDVAMGFAMFFGVPVSELFEVTVKEEYKKVG